MNHLLCSAEKNGRWEKERKWHRVTMKEWRKSRDASKTHLSRQRAPIAGSLHWSLDGAHFFSVFCTETLNFTMQTLSWCFFFENMYSICSDRGAQTG